MPRRGISTGSVENGTKRKYGGININLSLLKQQGISIDYFV